MIVEFIGLPGSGKSTLINSLCKYSSGNNIRAVTISQQAQQVLSEKKSVKGYLRRKSDRGWFFATYTFAREYPEVFRIVFENTIRNTPDSLDFLDLLGQYYFSQLKQDDKRLVLADEGLLHRGSSIFLYPNAYSDLDHYLNQIPPSQAVVWIDLDIDEAIERSLHRPKGLPQLYRKFTLEELSSNYKVLQDLHQRCLTHQRNAGASIIHVDSRKSIGENTSYLYDSLVKLCKSGSRVDKF